MNNSGSSYFDTVSLLDKKILSIWPLNPRSCISAVVIAGLSLGNVQDIQPVKPIQENFATEIKNKPLSEDSQDYGKFSENFIGYSDIRKVAAFLNKEIPTDHLIDILYEIYSFFSPQKFKLSIIDDGDLDSQNLLIEVFTEYDFDKISSLEDSLFESFSSKSELTASLDKVVISCV